ncbi:MAG: hypothetical protein EHM93_04855 [Bacteroidales bacterium]|nr:MAG: hypothetical protein EHM93_04855 [Bacteroidales bacterium]
MKSKFLKLGVNDIVKAIILTFITAFLTGVYQLLQTGTLLTWESLKPVLMTSIAAVIGYLLKNVFTNSNDKFLQREPGAIPPPPSV